MKKISILVFACCVMITLGLATLSAEKAQAANLSPAGQEAFSRGVTAFEKKDFKLALNYFLEARKADPYEPQIWFNLGLVSLKLPGYELRALAWFKSYQMRMPNAQNAKDVEAQMTAIEKAFVSNTGKMLDTLEPKIATDISASQHLTIAFARNNIGDAAGGLRVIRAATGKDNWQDALAQFQYEPGLSDSMSRMAKLENDKGRVEFLQDIGSNGLLLTGQFSDADLSEVIRLSKKEKNPEDAFKIVLNWVSEATGLYRVINGKYEPGVISDSYLARYYAAAYNNRCNAFVIRVQPDFAMVDCNKAIELDPGYAPAYLTRSKVYAYYADTQDQAIVDCTKAIELDPKEARAYTCRGDALYSKEQYDQAAVDYDRAIELNPKDATVNDKRRLAYKKLGATKRPASAYANRGYEYYEDGNYRAAYIEFHRLALANDPISQTALGIMHYGGEYVEQSYAEAASWFRKAAEQGEPVGQYNLAILSVEGKLGRVDYPEAEKWFRKSAEQGYWKAQYSLGIVYAYAQGVPQDYCEAATWYRKAAEQGQMDAQYALGVLYSKGYCVEKSEYNAAIWIKKAAILGHAKAQYNVGVFYDQGIGVKKNRNEAIKWYRKAAAQGDQKAQQNLNLILQKR